jgi:hypothetical protein
VPRSVDLLRVSRVVRDIIMHIMLLTQQNTPIETCLKVAVSGSPVENRKVAVSVHSNREVEPSHGTLYAQEMQNSSRDQGLEKLALVFSKYMSTIGPLDRGRSWPRRVHIFSLATCLFFLHLPFATFH